MTLIGKQEKLIEQFGSRTVSQEELPKLIRKSLGIEGRLNPDMSESAIEDGIASEKLIHHPMWLVRNMVVATRRPFKPKRIPNMIFVDAVSGYRGLLSEVPFISEVRVDKKGIVAHVIDEKEVGRYIEDVQRKQIDRSHVLKNPAHECSEPRLVHLPLWRVEVKSDALSDTFFINANTGESEAFMSRRWSSGVDLL